MSLSPDAHLTPILLAEDDEDSRRMLGYWLQSWGFGVVSVGNGLEAAEVMSGDNPPSLVLLDWMMPKMDGVEVCRHIRQQAGQPFTYIILLTAKSDKKEVAVGLGAGADDYVVKPCDMTELRARLRVGERMVAVERRLAQQVVTLQDALDQVRQLKELLPICAWCKRVRADEDYWQSIEEYLHDHAGTDFTHGICPHCVSEMRRKAAI